MVASKDPGHAYARTSHVSFEYYDQPTSPAPFGYEHYVSVPPSYDSSSKKWPLILFLHGAGEYQSGKNDSYASLRHGVPKIILCYDKYKGGMDPPHIEIPLAPSHPGCDPSKGIYGGADLSTTPVSPEVCKMVAEEFITVTPSLDMSKKVDGKKSHEYSLKTELQDFSKSIVCYLEAANKGVQDTVGREPESSRAEFDERQFASGIPLSSPL